MGLAVAVAIIGGVTLTLVAGALRTTTSPDRYAAARGDRYDTAMEQSQGDPLTAQVEALPTVADVASATFLFAGFLGDDGAPIDRAIVFAGEPDAFGAELVAGRLPDPDAPHEFAASPDFLDLTGAELGDRFPFISISAAAAAEFGFDESEPDGPSFDATLVGVVESPSVDLQDEYVGTVFPLSLLEEGSIGVSATESLVALVDGADIGDLREQLDTLPAGADLTLDPAEWVDSQLRRAVATQANALWVVAAIVAVAGLVVVGQVATRGARPADDQTRSLSAIGLTHAQQLAEILGRLAVPAVVGAIVASGGAVVLSGTFPLGFVSALEPTPGVHVEPVVHLLGVVVLVVGLVAWVGISLSSWAGSRRRPRPRSVVEAVVPRVARLQPAMGLRFAFARHPRDAGSISTPVVGLFALLALFVAAATFADSTDTLLDDPAGQGVTYDLGVGQGGGAVPAEAAATIAADPGVDSLSLLGNIRVSEGGTGLDLTGYESVSGDLAVHVLEGVVPTTDDQLALGATSAGDLGVGVGDSLTVAGCDGGAPPRCGGNRGRPRRRGGRRTGRGRPGHLRHLRLAR